MKKVYQNRYFATESLREVPKKLQQKYYQALKMLEGDFKHNLVKIGPQGQEVTLLHYQGLHKQPHPYLLASMKVNLANGEIKAREYHNNPQILHRLEEMLSKDNPRVEKLKKLTKKEEEQGMYQESNKIGRKVYWNKLCEEKNMPQSKSTLIKETGPSSNTAHKTARARKKLSAPVRWALNNNLITDCRENNLNPINILDWGCGKGTDSELLREEGYTVYSFDPHYNPINLDKIDYETLDYVLLNYVLNVIQSPQERIEILQEIKEKVMLNTKLLVSVRNYKSLLRQAKRSDWQRTGDGFLTKSGTFQKGYTMDELTTLLSEFGEVVATKKLSGSRVVIINL